MAAEALKIADCRLPIADCQLPIIRTIQEAHVHTTRYLSLKSFCNANNYSTTVKDLRKNCCSYPKCSFGFQKGPGPLPQRAKLVEPRKTYDQVHCLVTNCAQMEMELNKVLKLVKGKMICWIYFPQGSSGMQTDLTRDKGRDALPLSLANKKEYFEWIATAKREETRAERIRGTLERLGKEWKNLGICEA